MDWFESFKTDWLGHLKYTLARSIRVYVDIILIFVLWNFCGIGWFLILSKLGFVSGYDYCYAWCGGNIFRILLLAYFIGTTMIISGWLITRYRRQYRSKRKLKVDEHSTSYSSRRKSNC
jgi:hypothetical protein